MSTLTRIERRWARAVCETVYPTRAEGGALPLGVGEMDLDAFLDETIGSLPPEPAIGLRLAFFVLTLAPLFVLRRFALLPSLPYEDRARVLKAVASSRSYALRSTIIAVKAVLSLFYCGDLRVRPAIWGTAPSASPGPATDLVSLRGRKAPRAPEGAAHEQVA
jgi:hypothetical protein